MVTLSVKNVEVSVVYIENIDTTCHEKLTVKVVEWVLEHFESFKKLRVNGRSALEQEVAQYEATVPFDLREYEKTQHRLINVPKLLLFDSNQGAELSR